MSGRNLIRRLEPYSSARASQRFHEADATGSGSLRAGFWCWEGRSSLGRAAVEAALARGHEVTLFNRGETNAELFPEAEKLRGDRTKTSPPSRAHVGRRRRPQRLRPAVVRAAAEKLNGAAGHYVFVSSLSAYADFASKPMTEETRSRSSATCPRTGCSRTTRTTARSRLSAESAVAETFPDAYANVRPGLIVGPHDPTGRFTYWPHRVARGGEVLAPAPPDEPVQFIDVRDLGEWLVGLSERRDGGDVQRRERRRLAGRNCSRRCRDVAELRRELRLGRRQVPPRPGHRAVDGPPAVDRRRVRQGRAAPRGRLARDRGRAHVPRRSRKRRARRSIGAETTETAGLSAEREAALLAAWKAR